MSNSYDTSQSCEDLASLRAKMEVKSQHLFSCEEDAVKILQALPNEKGGYLNSIRLALPSIY